MNQKLSEKKVKKIYPIFHRCMRKKSLLTIIWAKIKSIKSEKKETMNHIIQYIYIIKALNLKEISFTHLTLLFLE